MEITLDQENCTANLEGASRTVFIALNVVSGSLAVAGNFLILLTVYRVRSLHTVSNYFICSLACADFLVGLLLHPLYIAIVALGVWASDNPLYQAENYLWMQSLAASTFSLAAISVDRYIAVTAVFYYYARLHTKSCVTVISLIWVFSIAFASLTLVVPTEDDSKLWVSCVTITVGLPFSIIVYCYYHIYSAAKRQAKSIAATYTRSTTIRRERLNKFAKNQKAAITTAIVIGMFLISFAPNFFFSIIEIATTDKCKKLTVYRLWLWAIWLAFSSSACNPWVYGIRSREYRTAFRIYMLRSRKANYFAPRSSDVELRSCRTVQCREEMGSGLDSVCVM